MRVDVVTLFPELFDAVPRDRHGRPRGRSRARSRVRLKSPRDFGLGRHQSVDDTPYGGGSGMVMRVDCIVRVPRGARRRAVDRTRRARAARSPRAPRAARPAGRALPPAQRARARWRAASASRSSAAATRASTTASARFVDEELSLGDFVMSGGEVAAMAVIDACARLLPGVLGNAASAEHESHSAALGGLLEYPQYTRPVEFRGLARARGAPGRQPRRDRRLAPRRGRAPHRASAAPISGPRRGARARAGERAVTRLALALVHHPVLDRAGGDGHHGDHQPRPARHGAERAHLRRWRTSSSSTPSRRSACSPSGSASTGSTGSGKRRIPDRATAIDAPARGALARRRVRGARRARGDRGVDHRRGRARGAT